MNILCFQIGGHCEIKKQPWSFRPLYLINNNQARTLDILCCPEYLVLKFLVTSKNYMLTILREALNCTRV